MVSPPTLPSQIVCLLHTETHTHTYTENTRKNTHHLSAFYQYPPNSSGAMGRHCWEDILWGSSHVYQRWGSALEKCPLLAPSISPRVAPTWNFLWAPGKLWWMNKSLEDAFCFPLRGSMQTCPDPSPNTRRRRCCYICSYEYKPRDRADIYPRLAKPQIRSPQLTSPLSLSPATQCLQIPIRILESAQCGI
jgi:hypothetical protein